MLGDRFGTPPDDDEYPILLHNSPMCHQFPSLAMPDACGAVPHHCGVLGRGRSILGFGIKR